MQWPELHYADWADTCETFRLWTQVAGKVRMAKSPAINHWWHVTLYVTTRGLATSPIPDGDRFFDIEFDFVAHRLNVTSTDGRSAGFDLRPMSVAEFYRRTLEALGAVGVDVKIYPVPSEVENPIPFAKDQVHGAYDAAAIERFFAVMVQAERVLRIFRSRFIGKVSPVHFFWGGFDMASTRFSGRKAPPHRGGIPGLPDYVPAEAYSHEVYSLGFWPGAPKIDTCFYAYAYPEPEGFPTARIGPEGTYYNTEYLNFTLPYEVVRKASDPDDAVLRFAQTTYEAAADLAKWDRAALER
jgi:hypothetical protein